MYTQRVQRGESFDFRSFLDSLPDSSFDWLHLINSYSNVFGKEKIIVCRYGKSFLPAPHSLLVDFCQILEIDFQNLIHEGSLIRNQSYSRDALEIARMCNPYLNSEERSYFRRVLQQASAKQPYESFSYFTNEHRENFLTQYEESNAIIARDYFNESSDVLFPFASNDRAMYSGISLEAVLPILAKAMLSMKLSASRELITLRILKKVEDRVMSSLRKSRRLYSKLRGLKRKIGI